MVAWEANDESSTMPDTQETEPDKDASEAHDELQHALAILSIRDSIQRLCISDCPWPAPPAPRTSQPWPRNPGRPRQLRQLRRPRQPRRLQLSASLPCNREKTRGWAHSASSQRRVTPNLIHHTGKQIQQKKQSNGQTNLPVSPQIHHPGSASSPTTPSISDKVAIPGPESGHPIETGN